jgi:hypothetical protein
MHPGAWKLRSKDFKSEGVARWANFRVQKNKIQILSMDKYSFMKN